MHPVKTSLQRPQLRKPGICQGETAASATKLGVDGQPIGAFEKLTTAVADDVKNAEIAERGP
jgi:hypothetical protein